MFFEETLQCSTSLECGLQSFTPNVKIVGGSIAVAHSWPSIVFIQFKYKLDYVESGNTFQHQVSRTCSGTLINQNTVLTAAQCYVDQVSFTSNGNSYNFPVATNTYYPTFESMYSVYLGFHDISDIFTGTFTYPGRKISVTNFIKHPNFDSTNLLNDIAILKLSSKACLDSYVKLSCLPTVANYPATTGIDVWTAGWGDLSENNNVLISLELNNVKFTLYPDTQCTNVMTSMTKDWTKQLCAGDVAGGPSRCCEVTQTLVAIIHVLWFSHWISSRQTRSSGASIVMLSLRRLSAMCCSYRFLDRCSPMN